MFWKIGNGKQVKLGRDSFIRGDGFYKISPTIILCLQNMGIRFLVQVKIPYSVPIASQYCPQARMNWGWEYNL